MEVEMPETDQERQSHIPTQDRSKSICSVCCATPTAIFILLWLLGLSRHRYHVPLTPKPVTARDISTLARPESGAQPTRRGAQTAPSSRFNPCPISWPGATLIRLRSVRSACRFNPRPISRLDATPPLLLQCHHTRLQVGIEKQDRFVVVPKETLNGDGGAVADSQPEEFWGKPRRRQSALKSASLLTIVNRFLWQIVRWHDRPIRL